MRIAACHHIDYRFPSHKSTAGLIQSIAGNVMFARKLVDKANDWLRKNNDLQVRTCETITWMSHSNKTLGDSEQMVLTKRIAENASTYCARGLRLVEDM